MNAEIIAVGSELLLGQITNTNARYISSQLAELGVNVYYHTVVGDNSERLKQAIELAESRADLIIFSGGLGPTKDDLTKETISRHVGEELVMDQSAMLSIEAFFQRVNRPMTENNRKQALVLEGCKVLKNNHGMAPGMFYSHGNHVYILLPGPPKELEPMFQFEAKPALAKWLNQGEVIISHVLRFYGIGEAELETQIVDLLENQTNPTIAPLASDGEVTLRITAKTSTEEEAWKLIQETQELIMSRVGDYLYGYNDDSLASSATKLLIDQGLTISVAESLTAGLFQSELAAISGVSQTLVGGVVTYTADSKVNQLGVSKEIIDQYGVVSEECAIAMATRVKKMFKTDVGVALTGAAGPAGHDEHPAGTVWIAIILPNDEVVAHQLHLSDMRNTNRLRAVKRTLHYLIQLLSPVTKI
ncbi:competence/damage-inducible protein A [Paenisporosarcina sp. TG20]|uniref:competence/damage-inducible protein A n=1 Tax=Paenisporosarcina sp. TG20 TaxID=1211706 RepID=UPI000474D989|nr:competence/damage-inducible protein A [Paenisporosarcina sp. TG20]